MHDTLMLTVTWRRVVYTPAPHGRWEIFLKRNTLSFSARRFPNCGMGLRPPMPALN